ncbi:MAG: GNAT family N-acetyltransferase [Euryarchaeota archaeon]|jgi:GNAT superfamily N-acetyltransferase|nr:GNAT family N-acetyltransferase [Euryarchaeota archaeon]
MEPVYRNFREDDIPEMAEIMSLTCDVRGYTLTDDQRQMIFESYLAELLARTTYVCIADVDETIAGYIMGGVIGDETVRDCCRGIADRGPGGSEGDDASLMIRDLQAIYDTDERMLSMCGECGFDSELMMYIMRPQMKGIGIGRRLLLDFMDHLRGRGCRKMFFFTDWFNDAHAFMHMGYVQTAFAMVEQGPEGKSYPFYIFSKDI